MFRERRPASPAIAALSVVSAAVALTAAGPAPAALADTTWTVRPSPFTLGMGNLLGVSATGPDSVLIGGYQWLNTRTVFCPETGPCTVSRHQNPALQRWTGSGWSWTSTPGLTGRGKIKFVDATSADGAWAAGSRDTFDGTSEGTPYLARATAGVWSEVAAPSALRVVGSLDADAEGAWVSGSPASPDAPSVFRHAPGTWVPHTLGASIQGIRQRTPADVWAVGRTTTAAGQYGLAYAARYDGTTWHPMTPPQAEGKEGRLVAVLPLAADDVWVTGYVKENGVRVHRSYHWDGATWQEETLPQGAAFGDGQYYWYGPDRDNGFYSPSGLVEDGAGGLWAVPSTSDTEPRILHYTGGSWKLEQPLPGVRGRIQGITRIPGTTTLWAVGQKDGKDPLVISTD